MAVLLKVAVLLCVLAGAALGIYLWSQQGDGLSQLLVAHISIGIVVTVCVLLQATAVALRPRPDSKLRCATPVIMLLQHWHRTPEMAAEVSALLKKGQQTSSESTGARHCTPGVLFQHGAPHCGPLPL